MTKANQLPSVSSELQAKIEQSHTDVQSFIDALNEENKRLNKRNAALEATNSSLTNRLDELTKHRPPESMSEEELKREVVPLVMQEVRDSGGWGSYCEQHRINPETVLFDHRDD